MMRHPAVLSGAAVVLIVLVWFGSPYAFDRIGLGDFDPLDRICLIFLLLSAGETLAERWRGH